MKKAIVLLLILSLAGCIRDEKAIQKEYTLVDCLNITENDERVECYTGFAIKLKDYRICENITGVNDWDYVADYTTDCYMNYIDATGREDVCKIKNDTEFTSICYMRLTENKKNPEYCKKIDDRYDMKYRCLIQYGQDSMILEKYLICNESKDCTFFEEECNQVSNCINVKYSYTHPLSECPYDVCGNCCQNKCECTCIDNKCVLKIRSL